MFFIPCIQRFNCRFLQTKMSTEIINIEKKLIAKKNFAEAKSIIAIVKIKNAMAKMILSIANTIFAVEKMIFAMAKIIFSIAKMIIAEAKINNSVEIGSILIN